MSKQIYSTGETARILDLPQRTVHKYCSTGRIPALQHPLSKTWKIYHDDLAEYMKENRLSINILQKSYRVIAVFNDHDSAFFTENIFIKHNFKGSFSSFTNSYEAMMTIGETPPDVFVVDYQKDGRKIIDAIKVKQKKEKIKILVIINYHRENFGIDEISDIDAFLVKPFTGLQLVKKIKEICHNQPY